MKSLLPAITILLFFAFQQSSAQTQSAQPVIEPDAVRPTPQQIDYQRQEKIAFVHFGVNTYTNREWGTGNEDPSIFNPVDFDAEQWVRVLSRNGFKTLVLTAKHHDGFSLWPSKATDHDVESSPWKNGEGDIVKEVSDACKKYGIRFGVYLSPWDMHEPSYGTPAYNDFYMTQLRELLTNYGPVAEVWFDGAKGEDAKDMEYDFEAWWDLVRELQPEAVIFSDEGPDVRWIGNEHGFAGETNWSKINRDSVSIGGRGQGPYLNSGVPNGPDWVPGECNTSIRPGWFYHPEEDDKVKPLGDLMEVYYKSIGRNCTMMINIPPTPGGRFHPNDVERLDRFSEKIDSIFDRNLASDGRASVADNNFAPNNPASNLTDGDWNSYWIAKEESSSIALDLEFDSEQTFNHLVLQEFIPLGQRVAEFQVLAQTGDNWKKIAAGTTVGHKRILKINSVTTPRIRILIEKSYGLPALNEIGVYSSE